jgi:hypothetical protein
VNGILGMCNWLYRWYDTDTASNRANGSNPEQVKQVFLRIVLEGLRKK